MPGMQSHLTLRRSTQIEGVECIHAVAVSHSVPPQAHAEFEIVLIEEGVRRFQFRGGAQIASAGSVVVIPSGEMHGSCALPDTGVTARIACIQPALLNALLPERAFPWQARVGLRPAVIEDTPLAAAFQQAHILWCLPASSALAQQSVLLDVLTCLLARCIPGLVSPPPDAREPCAIRQAREFLQAHYCENVSLTQLAQVADLSPFYLSRLFRRETGLTPHAYQTSLRLNRARVLLAQGQPVAEVALQTGFYDQAHFTHCFTRHHHISPARYAQADG